MGVRDRARESGDTDLRVRRPYESHSLVDFLGLLMARTVSDDRSAVTHT